MSIMMELDETDATADEAEQFQVGNNGPEETSSTGATTDGGTPETTSESLEVMLHPTHSNQAIAAQMELLMQNQVLPAVEPGGEMISVSGNVTGAEVEESTTMTVYRPGEIAKSSPPTVDPGEMAVSASTELSGNTDISTRVRRPWRPGIGQDVRVEIIEPARIGDQNAQTDFTRSAEDDIITVEFEPTGGTEPKRITEGSMPSADTDQSIPQPDPTPLATGEQPLAEVTGPAEAPSIQPTLSTIPSLKHEVNGVQVVGGYIEETGTYRVKLYRPRSESGKQGIAALIDVDLKVDPNSFDQTINILVDALENERVGEVVNIIKGTAINDSFEPNFGFRDELKHRVSNFNQQRNPAIHDEIIFDPKTDFSITSEDPITDIFTGNIENTEWTATFTDDHSGHLEWDQLKVERKADGFYATLVADKDEGAGPDPESSTTMLFKIGGKDEDLETIHTRMARMYKAMSQEDHDGLTNSSTDGKQLIKSTNEILQQLVEDPEIVLREVTNGTFQDVSWIGLPLNRVKFKGCEFNGCELELQDNVEFENCCGDGNEFNCVGGKTSAIGFSGAIENGWSQNNIFTGRVGNVVLKDSEGPDQETPGKPLRFGCDLLKLKINEGGIMAHYKTAADVRDRLYGMKLKRAHAPEGSALAQAIKWFNPLSNMMWRSKHKLHGKKAQASSVMESPFFKKEKIATEQLPGRLRKSGVYGQHRANGYDPYKLKVAGSESEVIVVAKKSSNPKEPWEIKQAFVEGPGGSLKQIKVNGNFLNNLYGALGHNEALNESQQKARAEAKGGGSGNAEVA